MAMQIAASRLPGRSVMERLVLVDLFLLTNFGLAGPVLVSKVGPPWVKFKFTGQVATQHLAHI